MKKVLLWVLTVIVLSGALAFFPSFGSLLLLFCAIVIAPINAWQNILKKIRISGAIKIALIAVLFVVGVCTAQTKDDTPEEDPSVIQKEETGQNMSNPEQTDSPDTNKEAAPKVEETDSPTDGAEIERGQYTLPCGMILNFSPSVRNDVTGQWKISTTSDSLVPADYAIEYYNALFSSDDEIHAIWNATLNTTTRITVSNGMLYVDTLEYVAGEEHDANILFSGNVLDSKIINIETGEEVSFDDDEEPSAETKPFTEAEPPTQSQTESIVDTKDQEQQLEHIHIWVDATCTEPKKCTRCGITDGKPLGHDMVPATTSAPSTCSRCGYTEGKPLEPEKETPPPPSQEVNTPDSNIPDGQKVYRTKTGKKYHYDNTCNGANYFETTWEEIKKLGLEPCEKCVLK